MNIPQPVKKNWYREYMEFVNRADWLGVEWARYMKTRKDRRK